MSAATSPPLAGQSLTTWAVMPGGKEVCMSFAGAGGQTHRITLPAEALTSLLMTIPRMLQAAVE